MEGLAGWWTGALQYRTRPLLAVLFDLKARRPWHEQHQAL